MGGKGWSPSSAPVTEVIGPLGGTATWYAGSTHSVTHKPFHFRVLCHVLRSGCQLCGLWLWPWLHPCHLSAGQIKSSGGLDAATSGPSLCSRFNALEQIPGWIQALLFSSSRVQAIINPPYPFPLPQHLIRSFYPPS